MEEVIRIEGLRKSFGQNEILKGIDFSIQKGEVVCLIGASGSGKSTMLRCINLLEVATGGAIYFHGTNILEQTHGTRDYCAKLGMVFQSFNLFENLTALQNCVMPQRKVLHREKAQAESTAMEYLSKVGMEQYANAKPRQLSGGQKQRVAIAGVIAMRPDCLVLDESTAMLDPIGREKVMRTVKRLNQEFGITVVMITHYMEEAVQADRVLVMSEGQICLEGTPKQVFRDSARIRELKLDVPQAKELCDELRAAGIDLPDDIITAEECADALAKLFGAAG